MTGKRMNREANRPWSEDEVRRGALVIGAVMVAVASPALLKLGRQAYNRLAGMTYQDRFDSGRSTAADPARGKPA